MTDDKNCACQPDVAIELGDLRKHYRDLAEENLRMRHLMQQDTTEIAKLKLRIAQLEKESKNAT